MKRKPKLRGGYCQTNTGKIFYPVDGDISEIDPDELAGPISKLCRFNGWIDADHYSVAQHCVLVARLVEKRWPHLALAALFHDAQESLGIADVMSPVKHSDELEGYRRVEHRLQLALAKKLGVDSFDAPEIKIADLTLLATEIRDFQPRRPMPANLPKPLKSRIQPWTAKRARREFLREYRRLSSSRIEIPKVTKLVANQ